MIIGHFGLNENILNRFIYSFHMPLFFIVSGMLYNNRKTVAETVKQKVKSLLIPYLSFGLLYVAVFCVWHGVKNGNWDNCMVSIRSFLLFPTKDFPLESAMWFLPVMFITTVSYYLLDARIKNKAVLSIVILLIGTVGFVYPNVFSFRLPWGCDCACVALLFFHSGVLIQRFDLIGKVFGNKKTIRYCFMFVY